MKSTSSREAKEKPAHLERVRVKSVMRTLLNVLAFLSLISGIGLGLYSFLAETGTLGNPTLGAILGLAYFVGGLSGYALFGGVAEVLKRLEALEQRK